LFQVRWTNTIHDEWIDAAVLRQKAFREKRMGTRAKMDRAIPDALLSRAQPSATA
jgi:hypothetical protein